jgi:hypothetical protein
MAPILLPCLLGAWSCCGFGSKERSELRQGAIFQELLIHAIENCHSELRTIAHSRNRIDDRRDAKRFLQYLGHFLQIAIDIAGDSNAYSRVVFTAI